MLSFRPIRHSVAHRGFRWSQPGDNTSQRAVRF